MSELRLGIFNAGPGADKVENIVRFVKREDLDVAVVCEGNKLFGSRTKRAYARARGVRLAGTTAGDGVGFAVARKKPWLKNLRFRVLSGSRWKGKTGNWKTAKKLAVAEIGGIRLASVHMVPGEGWPWTQDVWRLDCKALGNRMLRWQEQGVSYVVAGDFNVSKGGWDEGWELLVNLPGAHALKNVDGLIWSGDVKCKTLYRTEKSYGSDHTPKICELIIK